MSSPQNGPVNGPANAVHVALQIMHELVPYAQVVVPSIALP
jgi:hypothetical protein